MPTSSPEVYIEEHNVIIGPGGVPSKTWPVYWSAIWVGALAAVAVALLFGLTGIAVGAHQVGKKVVHLHDLSLGGLIFSVIGAFFSFVIGGWIATRIAGLYRAENAILHGGIVWLVALPFFLILAAFGAGNFLGGWYGGLAGTPVWASSSSVTADPQAAMIARNSALGAITALLIGLVGSVIGGWFASGEPMSLTYRRAQRDEYQNKNPRARAA
jgi:uncharacterized membrane protein YeaQ/YmgE (transglycosylase-associated protein family)